MSPNLSIIDCRMFFSEHHCLAVVQQFLAIAQKYCIRDCYYTEEQRTDKYAAIFMRFVQISMNGDV